MQIACFKHLHSPISSTDEFLVIYYLTFHEIKFVTCMKEIRDMRFVDAKISTSFAVVVMNTNCPGI